MSVYYIALGVLAVFGGLLWYTGLTKKKNILFLGVAFVLLGGLSAVRYAVGYDYTTIYVPIYYQMLRDKLPLFGGVHEPGFVLLEKLILLFTQNYQAMFAVTSLLIVGLICYYYWKTSPNVCMSILLFVLLGQYYCSMNFVRQTLAAVITLFAIPFLQKRKFIGYLLIVLLAALFHKSALIMIPFYLVNLIPVSKYVLPVYAAFTAAAYFLADKIVALVTKYWYSGYSGDSEHVLTTFAFPFTLSAAVAFVLLFWGYKRMRTLDHSNYIYINYAFFTLFFVLMGTRVGILDRFSLYFEMVIPVAIPILLAAQRKPAADGAPPQRSFSKRGALLLGIVFVWGLSIHQYILSSDNHGVVPYASVFGQPVYQEYVEISKDQPLLALENLIARWEDGEIYELSENVILEPVG